MQPIGIINTPFTTIDNVPIQPKGARGVEGKIHINPEWQEGLQDLSGFSHLYLIYLFHKAVRTSLKVTPFMDSVERGVFATRSPLRPNHIGISIVRLVGVAENIVTIRDIDTLDNTPLLDLKPYIPAFDAVKDASPGWMTASPEQVAAARSDDRFE